MFISTLRLLFAFLPAPIQAFVFGFLALLALVLVFKFVSFVLSSIPFL